VRRLLEDPASSCHRAAVHDTRQRGVGTPAATHCRDDSGGIRRQDRTPHSPFLGGSDYALLGCDHRYKCSCAPVNTLHVLKWRAPQPNRIQTF
jgi:hypothetical protein